MPTHLPLRDSGTMTTSITPCPGRRCFDECTSRQLGLSQPTPLATAILKRLTRTCGDGQHQKSGAYHFDSSSSTHLQCQRINASQPTRSEPRCTNRCEEEGLTWPFAPSPAVYNNGVDTVREKTTNLLRILRAVFIRNDVVATTCGREHKPPHYTTQEDRLNDQR